MTVAPSDGDAGEAEQAFAAAYRRYLGSVTAYVLRRCARDDAPDVVAEVFLVAWRRWDEVPVEPNVRPWLLGVARRTLANNRRGLQRRGRLVQAVSDQLRPRVRTVPRNPIPEEMVDVATALESLPKEDQEILHLVAWEGLSSVEAALVLGISPQASRKRLQRARRRLEVSLRDDERSDSETGQKRKAE